MLNLFSAEPALENIFSDEQIRTLIHTLRREGKAEEVIYHTENKESFRYVITTRLHNNTDEKLIQTTTSVEKFKLQEDEFLEFVQASLDSGLVREKQYTFPLQQDYDDHACFECLRPIAIKHLRCINKVEKILSAPRPQVVVQDKSSHTTLLLFVLLITLIGGSFFLLRPLLNNQQSADLTLLFNTKDVQVQLGAKTYSSTGNQLNLTLPLGRYRLLAKKPGYKPARQDIFLTADEEKDIQLEKLHTLTVYADMEDSRVLLNGNIMGTAGNATPLKLTLTEGLYELSLTHPAISTSFQKKFQLNNDQIIKANLPHPRLTIHLNVDDAHITVAGKEYQVKGNELVLKPPFGNHQLIAHKDGYISIEKEVRINQQDQSLPITLEQILYHLSVTPNVANSSITVSCQNGEKYFGIASPDTPFQVETATELCTVLAENQGYHPMSKEVSLTADVELSITLEQLFLVTVYTNIDHSTVHLDGKELGKAGTRTPAVLSIPSGNYTITVSNPQATAPVQQELRIEKDQSLEIDLPLPRLIVKVNVEGATLLVDEKKHQVPGSQLTLELLPGSHYITAQKKGYVTLQREVLVRDGAQTFFKLRPPLHRLSIRSNIDKTAIYVKCKDGKEYSSIASTKTPFDLEAVAGACTITATKKGYKKLTQSATLPTNKEVSLQLVAVKKKRKEKKLTPDKKKQQVKRPQKKPTASPTVQSTSNPVPAASTPKTDPLQIKTEKKGCQNELSVGMPELCD